MSDEPQYKPGDRITAGALYRRIPNWEGYYKPHTSPPRPTESTFQPDSDEQATSMSLPAMTTIQKLLEGHEGFGICQVFIERFPADVRATYDPLPDDKSHVSVLGLKGKSGPIATLRRQLAFAADVLQAPKLPLLSLEERRAIRASSSPASPLP